MGKTTNILDLNNRLTKVEKENVAQNNYNSLKNRPKINGNLLTGDKTGTQLGLANAQDIGNLSDLNTTDKSSCVGAINEVNSAVNNLTRGDFYYYPVVSVNNVAAMTLPKANSYTILGVSFFAGQVIPEVTEGVTDGYTVGWISTEDGYLILGLVGSYANVNVGNILSVHVEIQ